MRDYEKIDEGKEGGRGTGEGGGSVSEGLGEDERCWQRGRERDVMGKTW